MQNMKGNLIIVGLYRSYGRQKQKLNLHVWQIKYFKKMEDIVQVQVHVGRMINLNLLTNIYGKAKYATKLNMPNKEKIESALLYSRLPL